MIFIGDNIFFFARPKKKIFINDKNKRDMDPDRNTRVLEIMSKFSQVAEVGDKVYMGLEGDSLFPDDYRGESRPQATIIAKNDIGGDIMLKLRTSGGQEIETSSMTASPRLAFEFTPDQFEGVLAREKAQSEAERALQQKTPEYRGDDDTIASLRAEIASMRATEASFRNTAIETMKSLAEDILYGKTDFSKTLTDQYTSMAEKSLYRGEPDLDDRSDAGSYAGTEFF